MENQEQLVKLTTSNVKVGDLFQFTKYNGQTESVYISSKMWKFPEFYFKVIEISQIRDEIKVEIYTTADNKSILDPATNHYTGRQITGTINLCIGSNYNDIWFKPYFKLDISRIKLFELEDDALIPEELYA